MLWTAPDARIGKLEIAGRAGQLHGGEDMLADTGGSHRMTFRLQAARRVDGSPAVAVERPLRQQTSALTAGRQSQDFVEVELGDREAVMQFEE